MSLAWEQSLPTSEAGENTVEFERAVVKRQA